MSVNCNVCGCDFDGPHVMDPSGEAVHQWNHECVTAIRAALAAAEAKLADERRHADALAGAVREAASMCVRQVFPHATLDWVLKSHAVRRAAEVANG